MLAVHQHAVLLLSLADYAVLRNRLHAVGQFEVHYPLVDHDTISKGDLILSVGVHGYPDVILVRNEGEFGQVLAIWSDCCHNMLACARWMGFILAAGSGGPIAG